MRRLLDSPWLYFGLAALLVIGFVASQVRVKVPKRPWGTMEDVLALRERDDTNILFILVDTLRADHLGAYGYERDTSPILDDMAEIGVRFARVRAQSTWTKTSMASLWTSSFPATNGILRFHHALGERVELPAERLREAGFHTGGIYRNGWVEPNFGFGQGFDLYIKPTPNKTPERFERRTPSAHPLQGTDLDATEAAVDFMRTHRNQRFFLYVHYMDVHQYLYEASTPSFGTRYVDAYDNAILWTDRNIARLVGEVDELGLDDRTIVVVLSDHGEAFHEHQVEGHAKDLYVEVTETPWIMLFPFRLREPVVVEARVRNVDVWPTLFDLLGMPQTPGVEGQSVLPLMLASERGEDLNATAPARSFAELDGTWGQTRLEPRPIVSVTEDEQRLIWHEHDDRVELYDLRSDPGETRDLSEKQPERVAGLRELIEAYRAGAPDDDARTEVELDEMMLNQLRALGYVVKDGGRKR